MSNGLTIDVFEFSEFDFKENQLTVNSEFQVEFTPNYKLILHISND